jgi:hypothetical protein
MYIKNTHFTCKCKSKTMERKVWNVDILSHVKQGMCKCKTQK